MELIILKIYTYYVLHAKEIMNEYAHLAGDKYFYFKCTNIFCQFRLNLLIKISFIPDFENVWSRGSKLMGKIVTSYILIKLEKIIRDFEIHFFSKVDSNRLFYNIKLRTNLIFFTKLATSENYQKSILEKSSLKRPLLFLPVLGDGYYKRFL